MKNKILAAFALCALFVGPARAQMSPDRLSGWLCSFFEAPDPALLARFPDYGMGPARETTRFRTAPRGGYTVHETKAASQSYKFTYAYQVREGRPPYGFSLRIEGDDAPLWPTKAEAQAALSRTGNVETDSNGALVAENNYDRALGVNLWRAEFDVESQSLRLEWHSAEDAAAGLGFCK